jgi:hypothetical protein
MSNNGKLGQGVNDTRFLDIINILLYSGPYRIDYVHLLTNGQFMSNNFLHAKRFSKGVEHLILAYTESCTAVEIMISSNLPSLLLQEYFL